MKKAGVLKINIGHMATTFCLLIDNVKKCFNMRELLYNSPLNSLTEVRKINLL